MAPIFRSPLLLLLTLLRLAEGITVDPDPRNASKPVIRIAFMLDNWGSNGIARWFLEQFNTSNRTLLPDYDVLMDVWRIRGGVTEAPVALVGMLADDTPTYHALAGPQNRQDTIDVAPAVARARMISVNGADSPSLSDRTLYPYAFRSARSFEGSQTVMYHIAASNGWRRVISIWQEQDVYDASNTVAQNKNITNYPTLSEWNSAAWSVEAWQKDLVDFVRSSRIRVVIVYVTLNTGWQFICRVHRAQLSGIQYYVQEVYPPGWFNQEFPAALGDCTKDEMYIASQGQLSALHQPVAPGVSLLGNPYPTKPEDDQSNITLTCMPQLTGEDVFNDWDLLGIGIADGSVFDAGSAQLFMAMTAIMFDSACAILVGLHDAIYNKGIPLSSIEERQAPVYEELVESLGNVKFQGAQGAFAFQENTGDPEFVQYIIGQTALPGKRNNTYEPIMLAKFPHGLGAAPEMTPVFGGRFIWSDGSSGLGSQHAHLGEFPDCGLERRVLLWDSCQPCPAGSAYDDLLQACRKCPAGQFQNRSGMDFCETAPPGWYVPDLELPAAIAPCPIGRECPQAGTVAPQPCSQGRFASQPGRAECELCRSGTYQNSTGQSDCRSCGEILTGGVTATIASTSPSECICPSGSFRNLGSDTCTACLQGMSCAEGSDMRHLAATAGEFPHAKPGFMTLASEPLIVYKCEEVQHCPGGPPGSCDLLRDPTTVGCGNCLDGAYESGEECLSCGDGSILPFAATCVAGVVVVIVVTIFINLDAHKVTAPSMMAMTVASLLMTGLQTVGVFSSMDIPWEHPVSTFMKLAEVFSFDLDILKVACVVGVNPARSFALRQLFAVSLIPLVWATVLVKKYLPRWGIPKTDIAVELCNAIGTLYTVFFISIVISAVDPFICYQHPGDNGESVRSSPSLLCFEGAEHTTMIIISMVAVLVVPVPFLGICTYGVLTYSSKIKMHRSSDFLRATRFLFLRYVPERYYFQIIALFRSFLLCLVPAMLRDEIAAQVLCICAVLCAYVLATDNLRPWRARPCNILDSTMGMFFMMLLLCAALFIESTSSETGVIGAISAAILISVILGVAIAFCYALWHHFAPSYFQFFICHHKAHAAAQARYMKIVLQKRRKNAQIFIDSDDLKELDTLFDIVKSRVRHLLVFLTADTLKRPWCVGEIVTALRTRIPITRFHTLSFVGPTEEQRTSPELYVDFTGCNLREYGIVSSDISWAFSCFLGSQVPQVDMNNQIPGTKRFEHGVDTFFKESINVNSPRRAVRKLSEMKSGSVLVVTDPDSDEASASAGILVDRIAPSVYNCNEHGIDLLCDYEQNHDLALRASRVAAVNVVMLSKGCLQSLTQLHIICDLMRLQAAESGIVPAVLSVNTPGFAFPSLANIKELCKSHVSLDEAYGDQAVEFVVGFFKRISILLPTDAAQHALNTQSDEVFLRIQDCLNRRQRQSSSPDGSFLKWAPSGVALLSSSWSGSGSGIRTPSAMSGLIEERTDDNEEQQSLPAYSLPVKGSKSTTFVAGSKSTNFVAKDKEKDNNAEKNNVVNNDVQPSKGAGYLWSLEFFD